MRPDLLWKVEADLYRKPIVQFKFQNFREELTNTVETSWGVFGIRKDCFEGFQNWKCNADVEYILRMKSKVDRMKPLQKIYILSLIRIKTLLENESSKSV